MIAQETNYALMCTEEVFYILWICPSRKQVYLCRTPFRWREERYWVAYLIFRSLVAPITPASTPLVQPAGLLIPGGDHVDVSDIELGSEPGSTTIAGAGTGDRALALAGDGIDVDSDFVSDAVLGDADFGRRLVRGYGKSVSWLVSVMSADALPSSPPMVVELESTDWGGEPFKEILVSRTWPAPTLLVVWKATDGRPTSA
jgi:hypothetical protein